MLAVSVLGFVFAPQLVAVFRDDPEVVAIGGGVAGAPEELLLKPVRELVERECYGRHVGKVPRIVTAELGGDAGLIGAASLRNVN